MKIKQCSSNISSLINLAVFVGLLFSFGCQVQIRESSQPPETQTPQFGNVEGETPAFDESTLNKIGDEYNLLECFDYGSFKAGCEFLNKDLHFADNCSKVVVDYEFSCLQPWAEIAFAFGGVNYKAFTTSGLERILLVGEGALSVEDMRPDRTAKMPFDMDCRFELKKIVVEDLPDSICSLDF